MRIPTVARLALAFALAICLGAGARGEDDEDTRRANPAAEEGFPWLCFAASLAAIGGLYVVVRRREQAMEEDARRGRGPDLGWYCKACDRDVSGAECPRCGAVNPFLHEPRRVDSARRSRRTTERHRSREHARRDVRDDEED